MKQISVFDLLYESKPLPSEIKLLSLFSGIGAFEKALDNLGIEYEILNCISKQEIALWLMFFITYLNHYMKIYKRRKQNGRKHHYYKTRICRVYRLKDKGRIG
jgi:hypothetical protein